MIALVLFAVAASGCASVRIHEEDLPQEPIAFLHWESKAAKKRSSAFGAVSELPPTPVSKFDPEGGQERDTHAYLRAEHSMMLSAKLAQSPGKLMILWPRTGEIERLHAAPVNSRPLAWSPDHKRLLFVSSHLDGRNQLYEYDFVSEHLSALTFGSTEHVRGDYDRRGGFAILRMRRAIRGGASSLTVHLASPGGQLEREVARDVPPGSLRLMPDGDRIVYEQVRVRPRRDGPTKYDSHIAIRSFEEGAEEQILIRGREPSLTPDGQWIVFASPSSAGYRLRRMRPDGTSRVPISAVASGGPGGPEERMPTVSPGGDFVAFIKDGGDSRRIFVRSFDGKQELPLLKSGWSEFPVW